MSNTNEEEETEKQLKVVLAGENFVGKTSIARRFAHDFFTSAYNSTAGVDFYLKRIILPENRTAILKIWDLGGTAGNMVDKYVFGANAVILVYDITNASTFDALPEWMSIILSATRQQEKSVSTHLLGNKSDQELVRDIRAGTHVDFARRNNIGSHFASAKTGDGVMMLFQKVASEILGIKISRKDKEQHHLVVEAQIPRPSTPHPQPVRRRKSSPAVPESTVCVIQ